MNNLRDNVVVLSTSNSRCHEATSGLCGLFVLVFYYILGDLKV
jgi:hypothetical protein